MWIPSRILNDQRGLFGLWLSDFFGAFFVFILSYLLLEESPYELVSIPSAVVFLVVLSPIRLRTRKHIVRDFLSSLITPKVVYDPKFSA